MSDAVRARGSSPPISRILPLLALLTALAPLSVDIYTPSLPRMQHELGGSDWLTQASITTFLLGIGFGQLFWGPLSDRFGRKPVVLCGVAGWAMASALSALVATPEQLVAVRTLAGLCGAAGIVVARSIVRDVSIDTAVMASRIGMLSMVTALAPVLAPVAGAAIADVWGWRADFVTLAALGLVILGVFAWIVPETLPAAARTPAGSAGVLGALVRAARDRELAGVALALGIHSFGFYAYIATTAFIVEREFGHPPAIFALVFGTNALFVILGNSVFRRLVRRHLHPSGPMGAGLAMCGVSGAVLSILALLHGPELLLWGASLAFASGQGLVLPGAHSWAQTTAVASGAASALAGSAQFLGGVLGSPVTGVLGPTAANLGLVIAVASSVALGAWAFGRRHLAGPVAAPNPADPPATRTHESGRNDGRRA